MLAQLREEKYRWVVFPVVLFIITRVLLVGGAYIAYSANQERISNENWVIEHSKPPPKGPLNHRVYLSVVFKEWSPYYNDNKLITMWSQWDTNHYRDIVLKGYTYDSVSSSQLDNWSDVAFFPIYPLMVSALMPLTNDFAATGLLVSNVCFLLALILLYRLIFLECADHSTAQRTLVYVAVFPMAVFFNAIYTESTFLLTSVATFYFARRRMWALAGVSGAVATATRFIGILLYGVLLLEWARSCGWTLTGAIHRPAWRRLITGLKQNWKGLLLIQLALAGLLSYMLFLYVQFGDPLGFLHAQAAWGRRDMINPLTAIWNELQIVLRQSFTHGEPHLWRPLLNVLACLFGLMLTPFIWKRWGESYALYTLFSVLIPTTTNTVDSMARYTAVVFPIFAMLAFWGRHTLLDKTITIGFSLFLGILTAIFVNGGFIG